MKITVENIEKNVVKLTITLESDKLKGAINQAYKKNAKHFNIPGFRKGKAPLSIIKQMYGADVFSQDASELLVNQTLHDAVVEKNLKVIATSDIDIVTCEEGKDFVYTAKITTIPEVELGEYKGLDIKMDSVEVTDEEVEADINNTREQNARIVVKEGKVEAGDIAVIDFEGFIDGVAFEGGKGEDQSLTIGSKTFIEGFEDQLIGTAAGETKDVVVTFPESYGKEELNGKEATFKVVIKEVKFKELPELDDEFVKEVSEFDTVEELKAETKKRIAEFKEHEAKQKFEDSLLDAAADNAKVDIPEVMIEQEIDGRVKELEQKLQYQGLDIEKYLQYTNSTMDKVRGYMKEVAEKTVKNDLVVGAIAKAEGIKIEEEEVKAKAMEIAEQWNSGEVEKNAEMLMNMKRDLIEVELINEKVIEILKSNVKNA